MIRYTFTGAEFDYIAGLMRALGSIELLDATLSRGLPPQESGMLIDVIDNIRDVVSLLADKAKENVEEV